MRWFGRKEGLSRFPLETRILYTGSLASGVPNDPPYEIRFLRDNDISPTPTARKDIVIDAKSGITGTVDVGAAVKVNKQPVRVHRRNFPRV